LYLHQPLASVHYVDERNASILICTDSYKSNMGFVDMSERMANIPEDLEMDQKKNYCTI
jgi:hypothetical protein